MDISDDSKLIVTCSADKNVKIWGLDFGDCHKSLFAHDESVMQVAFEKKSHYFWTVGKDKLLKYWDGDKVRYNTSLRWCRLTRYVLWLVREYSKIRGTSRRGLGPRCEQRWELRRHWLTRQVYPNLGKIG